MFIVFIFLLWNVLVLYFFSKLVNTIFPFLELFSLLLKQCLTEFCEENVTYVHHLEVKIFFSVSSAEAMVAISMPALTMQGQKRQSSGASLTL